MSDPMDEIRQTFFIECRELLEATESGLLELQGGSDDPETVNAVFRAVHSIKGGAGAFGFDALVHFAHEFESLLDDLRSRRLEPSRPLIDLMLRAADVLSELVSAAEYGTEAPEEMAQQLVGEIRANSASGEAPVDANEDDFAPVPMDFGFDFGMDMAPPERKAQVFQIYFQPKATMLANGGEPAIVLRELAAIGPLTVSASLNALPELEKMEPSGAYISWEIQVEAEDDKAIREAFEFFEGDCELSIQQLEAEQGEALGLPSLGGPEVDAAAELSVPAEIEAHPDAGSTPAVAEKVPTGGTAKVAANNNSNSTIRVDLDRVDRLINLVGELVVNQAMLSQSVLDSDVRVETSVSKGLDEFKQLVREVQDSVLAIRAQPVRSLFQRMTRVVREASSATGKDVRLEIEGEMTEIDKTVIEQLSDPLTHMVRNAVDHGLEKNDARLEAGKSAQGTISLSAAHRSGRVVIEVADDGGGINRDRVRAIAVEKGLIPEEAVLTPGEIDNILFLPGFSTASKVSDLSGRGVGMDVVKRSIQALGGKISIRSVPGKGTTFSISLPLTLALLDGMLVQVSSHTLVVPLTSISETIKPHPENIHMLAADGPVVLVRGEFIPVIDIGAALGLREPLECFDSQVFVLVEHETLGLRAFAVDNILDQRQVVIKSLEQNYQRVDGIAAATILGDGKIALILDPEMLSIKAAGRDDAFWSLSNKPEMADGLRRAS
ncbi:chemotaxis protein CheA [Hyphomonas sp. WL0036]|uniref:chemotaxis protein CheA n=1 Tax=Hyphomonas sediminis TaxID=2866160 RepID=UPI001C820698|nr:chemotaxis protein CheA [Hyphomonas sediminis]MBY9065759.1 chemotaxis protein CheA [Hyphomonas sediminis]